MIKAKLLYTQYPLTVRLCVKSIANVTKKDTKNAHLEINNK